MPSCAILGKFLASFIQFSKISEFLKKELKLELHPDKVSIKTFSSGVDFLGMINFSDHRVLRTKTKRRMLKRIKPNPKLESVASYFGLLSHGNNFKFEKKIRETGIDQSGR